MSTAEMERMCLFLKKVFFPLISAYLSKKISFVMFQWAEVLSYDAFSAFEEAGLDNVKVWTANFYTSKTYWCLCHP